MIVSPTSPGFPDSLPPRPLGQTRADPAQTESEHDNKC